MAAIVIVGAALAVQRSPRSPASIGDIVAADITLVTSDRADVECAAAGAVETYHCGFIDGSNAWKGEDKNN